MTVDVLAGSSSTDAALCTVTVSKDVLERDLVLELILQQVQRQTHQVTVVSDSSTKNVLRMSMGGGGGSSMVLTQRNAILRSLVGSALHGAMDSASNVTGCLMSGGFLSSRISQHGSSFPAAVNAACLIQWMSMADQIMRQQTNSDKGVDTVIHELEETLQSSAFLLPYAATVTLADMDVCVALLMSLASCNENIVPDDWPLVVRRWMIQVIAVLQRLATQTSGVAIALEKRLNIPNAVLPSSTIVPPMRFTGTEDVDAILASLYQKSAVARKKTDAPKPKVDATTGTAAEPAVEEKKKTKLTKQEKAALAKAQGGGDGKKAAAPAPAAAAEPTTFDITALDIRVGKIIKAWPHETADKLYCEEIDLGNGEIRQIASGLRPFYKSVEDLQDRMVLVLCNLKKRTLVGFPSHGMVLCASNADHTAVEFVVPPSDATVGERVLFGDFDASAPPEPDTKVAKKKIFESLAPDLKTNEQGQVIWKTHLARTSTGPVMALNLMPNASVS